MKVRLMFVAIGLVLFGCSDSSTKKYDKAIALLDRGDTKKAVELLVVASNEGYAQASSKLSELYGEGKIIEPDKEAQLKYIRLAAEQGDVDAQILWGAIVGDGNKILGIEADVDKSLFWFRSALSNTLDEKKKLAIAVYLRRRIMFASLSRSMKPVRAKESAERNVLLPNEKACAEIVEMAIGSMVNRGDAEACAIMAYIIEAGYEYHQNGVVVQAETLWKIAADKGNPEACKKMACKLASKDYGNYDPCKAIMYFEKGGQLHSSEEELYVRCLLENHDKRDPKKAVEIISAAIDNRDYLPGFYFWAIGNCYLIGDGVDKNIREAINYLDKAADELYDEARIQLAEIYYEGKLIEKNNSKARDYARSAHISSDEIIKRRAASIMERIDNEEKVKIEKDMANIAEKAEEERQRRKEARDRRIEEITKERTRREEESQAAYAKYAEDQLSKLSFKLTNYVLPHPYLSRQMKSSKVTDSLWGELIDAKKRRDWLGMLNAMNSVRLYKRSDKFEKYPDNAEIDRLIQGLCRHDFKVAFSLNNSNLYGELVVSSIDKDLLRVKGCAVDSAVDDFVNPKMHFIEGSSGIIGVELSFNMCEKLIIGQGEKRKDYLGQIQLVPKRYDDIEKKYNQKAQDIEAKIRLGQSNLAEEQQIQKLHEDFQEEVLATFKKSTWNSSQTVDVSVQTPRRKKEKKKLRLRGPVPVGAGTWYTP